MGPPSSVCWLINPMKTIAISTINHRIQPLILISQLNAIFGGPILHHFTQLCLEPPPSPLPRGDCGGWRTPRCAPGAGLSFEETSVKSGPTKGMHYGFWCLSTWWFTPVVSGLSLPILPGIGFFAAFVEARLCCLSAGHRGWGRVRNKMNWVMSFKFLPEFEMHQ